jgi:hypothetical protein
MTEAVRTSETSTYFNEISRRYNPESYRLHTRCREKVKSHLIVFVIKFTLLIYVVHVQRFLSNLLLKIEAFFFAISLCYE